jgi:hypothetical protein
MIRTIVALACVLSSISLSASDEKPPLSHGYSDSTVHDHEIKPHRHKVPLDGVDAGFHQIQLSLIISSKGDVEDAKAVAGGDALKFWPQLQSEVRGWKFIPFEDQGKPVTAEVVEYIDIVPPERLPKNHVTPPTLRPNSKVTITLQRTGCFGNCPSYKVAVSTDGIVFEGEGFVKVPGRHTDPVHPDEVRKLAKAFVAADFYSMDSSYVASVTDLPTYVLAISIDGHEKQVKDYVGSWVGMPADITELEDDVDAFARTDRWIK